MDTVCYSENSLKRRPSIFLKEKNDVGEISRDDVKNYVTYFDFVNRSEENVIINKIKTSCGCVQVDYPHAPIKPLQEGKIKVILDLDRIHGHFRKSLLVYYNNSYRVLLSVIGEVQDSIR